MRRRRAICMGGIVAIVLVAWASSASAGEKRKVTGCSGGPGSIELVSPEPRSYPSTHITLELEVACRGGLNFFVGVNGIGYAEEGDSLVPRPNANPGCRPEDSDCWPSLTAAAGEDWTQGTVRYRMRFSPGTHVLAVRHALGTDPPTFDRIETTFSVGGAALPTTGRPVRWLMTAAVVLTTLGAMLLPWTRPSRDR